MLNSMMTSEATGSATSTSPELSETERKRLRSREYVRRTYSKKKVTLVTLRDQLAQLEQQYQALLEERQQCEISGDDRSCDAQLLQHYLQLSEEATRLYKEKSELLLRIRECMLSEARLQQVSDAYAMSFVSEMSLYFQPLPHEAYMREIVACRDDALRFLNRPHRQSTGCKFFGWTDQRIVTGTLLEFAFEKDFTNITALDLLDRTWSILLDPKTSNKIYSQYMRPRVQLLQRIDEDSALFYWNLRENTVPLEFKSILLLSRLHVPAIGGYMIVFRSVDKDILKFDEDGINAVIEEAQNRPLEPPREVQWVKISDWVIIREVAPRVCRYHFGGSCRVRVWAIEVLKICVRWESLAFGSRLLPPSDSSDVTG